MKTVAEFITELQKLPPEMLVYVEGYESGVNDLVELDIVHIRRNTNLTEYYMGRHSSTDNPRPDDFRGVILS